MSGEDMQRLASRLMAAGMVAAAGWFVALVVAFAVSSTPALAASFVLSLVAAVLLVAGVAVRGRATGRLE
jgi:hypothetical protein